MILLTDAGREVVAGAVFPGWMTFSIILKITNIFLRLLLRISENSPRATIMNILAVEDWLLV